MISRLLCCLFLASSSSLWSGELPAAADQFPDLDSLPDAAPDLQRQVDENGGNLKLLPGIYRLESTVVIDLEKHGSASVTAGSGAVTLVMDGPGPALSLRGTHEGTASPHSFRPRTWREAVPRVRGVNIVGNHPDSTGIELVQTVQPIVSETSVRWCRHGIVLADRNRNVVISDCHLYENSGIGIYLDDVNLHQINVVNSHISYNRGGGIVVRDGNVRNFQISGCDLEANMPGDETPTRAANVWLDVSGSQGDRKKSIAEVAITGCTIQHSANYGKEGTMAPGGANIRLSGKEIWPIDSVTISGNVMSDVTVGLEIDHSMDIAITGNTFFAPKPGFLTATNSQRIVVNGNTFNPRQFERPGTIRFANCRDCILANSTLHRFQTEDGAVVIENCEGVSLLGLILTDCKSGIRIRGGGDILVENCQFRGLPDGMAEVIRE